jgi:prepilin-type processing-associated H-X9-DG protein
MTPDLLGYLLHSLEPAEERAVEEFLEGSPEARQQLLRLRQRLQPLDSWEQPDPPADFFYRTLRAIAARRTEKSEAARATLTTPVPLADRPRPAAIIRPWAISEVAPGISSWRRPDVWVSIAMLLMVCLSIPPVLRFVRERAHQVECRENMRYFHPSLVHYADMNGGFLPGPQASGPLARAGVVVPTLYDNGLLTDRCKIGCDPSCSMRPVALQEVRQHDPNDAGFWTRLGGSYGYQLGYVVHEGNTVRLMPIRIGDGNNTPILADRPPRAGEANDFYTGNSPNHGGRGQNVLYLDGHICFQVTRQSQKTDDMDIYLNQQRKQAAGTHARDSVLAPSEAAPLPEPIE